MHLGKLQGEFQPQKNRQARGERADELLMPLADAAQFARGEKARLPEIVAANVAGPAAFAHALRGEHEHVTRVGRGGGRAGFAHDFIEWQIP